MDQIKQVEALENWYAQNKRDLVFRKDQDPYHIWVSEVMAQQTQIVTMTPYYISWIEQFPSIEALANASMEQVLMLWHGLGYYSRARNLKKGAEYIMEYDGGTMPSTYEQLIQIPGIGPYIGAAISSIAYDQPITPIDGNVNRVVARFLTMVQPLGSAEFKKEVVKTTDQWMVLAKPRIFAQALMELGALVCTPKNPKCDQCPLNKWCRGQTNPLDYPVKKPKAKVPVYDYEVKLLQYNHQLALVKPPYDDHLMEGYYRFPMELMVQPTHDKPTIKHVYSHLVWQLYGSIIAVNEKDPQYVWVDIDSLMHDYPLIVAHQKLLKKLYKPK